jgi:CRP-like cAMP-binding protein
MVREMPLFAGLPAEVLQRLMADAAPVTHQRGKLLFSAGAAADCFFIVLSGQVKLFALLPDGRESVIEVIRPVSSFGEAAMLAGRSFPVNAEVIEEAILIRVGRNAFLAALHSDHQTAYRILASLCGWQQRLAGEVQLLREQPAWQRVAEYLLTLAAGQSGEAVIRLPFTKEVLASRVGIRRESLSRVLARLRLLGVESNGGEVHIADLAVLRSACCDGSAPAL